MSDLGKNLDEQTYHARADRRFTQGQVTAVDGVSYTCTLDVGAVDVTGTPVYLQDVPYQAQTPPSVGDMVALVYANASPQSVSVSGSSPSGQTAGSTPLVVGAVTSLAPSGGGTAIEGAVQIAGAGGVSISGSGQTITVTGSGITGITAESGGSSQVGPESVLNFVAGSNISSITVGDDTGVTPHRIDVTINASGGGGSGVSSLNSLTGGLTLAAGTNVTLSTSGSTITINASGGSGGVSSLNSLTGGLTIAAGSNVTVTNSGSTITIASSGGGSSYSFDLIVGSTGFNVLDTDTVTFAAGTGLSVTQSSISGGVTVTYSNDGNLPVTVLPSSTATYTALASDDVIFCFTQTTALILTLPTPVGIMGKVYEVFDAYQGATQGITVTAAGGSVLGITTIQNGTTGTERISVSYISDGSNWHSFRNSQSN